MDAAAAASGRYSAVEYMTPMRVDFGAVGSVGALAGTQASAQHSLCLMNLCGFGVDWVRICGSTRGTADGGAWGL
jgi:hypothetical protein